MITTKRLTFQLFDIEVIKTCEITVWEEAEEKGFGECPSYPAECGIESIMSDGVDVTQVWGSKEELDDLALSIMNDEIKDSEETKASNKYDEQTQEV